MESMHSASTAAATDIVADAVALQERDEFRAHGWMKLIAPAKVNLHLAIGMRRADGYHEAVSIMHALNVHDVVYLRRKTPDSPGFGTNEPDVHMVPGADIIAPELPSADNIAAKAVVKLASALRLPPDATDVEIRIEKNIPFEGGLGGGSTDAAAALLGAARLWERDFGAALEEAADDWPSSLVGCCEDVARSLGADVAFFLHGGCSAYGGAGDAFIRALLPSKRAIALVKPDGGVSTAEAYRSFDEDPVPVPDGVAGRAQCVEAADELALFNNLAPAAERIMPELAAVREWLAVQSGVSGALLCGSGATTFAVCDSFAAACAVVTAARRRGWWARATSFGSARVMEVASPTASPSAVPMTEQVVP